MYSNPPLPMEDMFLKNTADYESVVGEINIPREKQGYEGPWTKLQEMQKTKKYSLTHISIFVLVPTLTFIFHFLPLCYLSMP